MHKRKLLIGLATAGCFSAGFGAAVFPASADQRLLTVTLLGGQTVQVTVDVPPGTPLDQLSIPGITTPIVGISETPAASAAPAGPTGPDAAATTTTAAAPTTPDPDATTAPAVGDVPTASHQDSQQTTGKAKRKPHADSGATGATGTTGSTGATGPDAKPAATPDRAADGVPTDINPTYSYALPGGAPIGVPNFFIDNFRIPPFLLPIYQAAGIQYGIPWQVLAGINEIETDYGRNLNVSSAGALGWMQFLPSTWKRYGVDANDDGKKDPYNPVDAIFGTARYLKAAGGDKDIRKAVFAYNHADWYVSSVLMRARLIGGLPSDLVGSLTGLTEGHFPVHATARYADDLSERDTHERIARGKNAAMPVEANTSRRGINIYAKAGSPAIATQDGKIVAMGHTKRLGRYLKLRDLYGNTYTYAQLAKVAKAHPVPKAGAAPSKADIAHELDLPKRDPAPTQAASAGTQRKPVVKASRKVVRKATPAARVAPDVVDTVTPKVTKERLFAQPAKAGAFAHGGQEQILNSDTSAKTFKSYFTEIYGLKRSEVTIKPLRVGSKVIAGTILGRLGRTSKYIAPHLLFEIRPAGRGAPRIDPKPILDGWKLLESTSIYRAAGKNPFFGPDAKNPTIGQILLMSKEALQRRVLADPHADIYACGRQDIEGGQIDRRVLATIEFLTASGLNPTITALRCGHGEFTSAGNVSEHSSGNAVDIAKINGIPILGHQGPGSITDITIRRLLTLQGTMKPHQIISLMTFDGADNTLSLPDHADHIHIGFKPLYSPDSKLGRQVDAVLKPGQWIKLIDRIGEIDNPTVLTTPSKAAIPVAKPSAVVTGAIAKTSKKSK